MLEKNVWEIEKGGRGESERERERDREKDSRNHSVLKFLNVRGVKMGTTTESGLTPPGQPFWCMELN